MVPRKRTNPDEHTFLALQVDGFHVFAGAGINLSLLGPSFDWQSDQQSVFTSDIRLEILATCLYPPERTASLFEVTVVGVCGRGPELTLKDINATSKTGAALYKERRGIAQPIYNVPRGIAVLQKNRGMDRWTTWVKINPIVVGQMLQILQVSKTSYLALH